MADSPRHVAFGGRVDRVAEVVAARLPSWASSAWLDGAMARFTPDRITDPAPSPDDEQPGPWVDHHNGLVDSLLANLREEGRREAEGKELARVNAAQEIEERAERAQEREQAAEDRRFAALDREQAAADRAVAARRFRATLLVSLLSAALAAAGLVITLTSDPEAATPPPTGQVEQVTPQAP